MKHVPKHRHAPARSAVPRKALRTTVVLSSIAAATTGATVSGGLLAADSANTPTTATAAQGAVRAPAAPAAPDPDAADRLADRQEDQVSRSDRRAATDPAKVATLDQEGGRAMTRAEDLSDADPREIGKALLPEFGFGQDQFGCLDRLFVSESNWRVDADNPTSSAYGIPQALTELHDLPDDYLTNPVTQIRWGLRYIERRYGSPCNAWSFKQGNNWY